MNAKNAPKVRFRIFLAVCTFLALALSSLPFINNTTVFAKPKFDTPTITCAGSTEGSIDIMVCAGASGAPAGFSIQWETLADFNTFGWPADSSCPLDVNGNPTCGDSFCKASFSGNASGSRYNLGSLECVTVRIGDLLFDNGASTDCPDALRCGTTYVFRAFAHANSAKNRSDFTANLLCSTQQCGDVGGCVFGQGYWKTHGPTACNPSGGANVWPVTSLTLGTVTYTDLELCSILNKPAQGNGLLTLAHQLIAAKLNLANGATSCTAVESAIAAADALIGGLVIPPVGSGFLSPGATSGLVLTLDNYNSGSGGEGCPSLCDE